MRNKWIVVLGIGILIGTTSTLLFKPVGSAIARGSTTPQNDMAALKTEVDALKHLIPDQAHAMTDVDYQFTNLWFASQNGNWPLAEFYLGETRSHLNWAVRIRPIRKLSSGQELDLTAVLRGVESSSLTGLKSAVSKQDLKMFETAYRQTITECYACHRAAEKPYLRPQIPETPATHVINMRPNADWPH